MNVMLLSLCLTVGQPPYEPPPVAAPGSPLPPPVVMVLPDHPMTLCEFKKCFVPCPGHHEVCLIHPVSGNCVRVCFDLPDCCLKCWDVSRRSIDFRYCGGKEVRIVFRVIGSRCDRVDVLYR
jgi:hypothetical protein